MATQIWGFRLRRPGANAAIAWGIGCADGASAATGLTVFGAARGSSGFTSVP